MVTANQRNIAGFIKGDIISEYYIDYDYEDDDDYEDRYLLKIYPISNRISYEVISDPLCGEYDPFELEIFKSDELVDSLFNALVWVITNKYMLL